MFTTDKRIRIIVGYYGSGKSEFALNYAIGLAQDGAKVALADLDVVNTYFRSREQRKVLASYGIKVLTSALTEDNVDLPALSPRIVGPLEDKSWQYVLDMGGARAGLMPLAWLKPYLEGQEVDVLMVVNVNREETNSAKKIIEHIAELEAASKCKITGFVHNTNLIRESSLANLLAGQKILAQVAEQTGIPVRYTSYVKAFLEGVDPSKLVGTLFPLTLYLRKDWM